MHKTLFGVVLVGGFLLASPFASASTSCSGYWVKVNTGAGAEAPSWKIGHKHRTGNHYIRYSYWSNARRSWSRVWYADNNGGWDGDTWDTYYNTRHYC